MKSKYHIDTIALHGGQIPDPATGARAVPIYQTTSFVFKDSDHAARLFALDEPGYIYSRMNNPTWEVLEARVADLERGAGALATASGQSAILLSILNIAGQGDEIVSSSSLYGGSFNLFTHTLPRFGIKTVFVDPSDPENFRSAINEKTKLVFFEVMGNPKSDVHDIEAISSIAHDVDVPVIVDNTSPTPYLCRPIDWGADIVVHSLTKFMGGHGTSIGGVIVDGGKFNWSDEKFAVITSPDPSYHGLKFVQTFGQLAYIAKARVTLLRDLGPALSPFNAFLLLQGIETLHLRMQRHCENAMSVARFLAGHPMVEWVNYPGLPEHPTHGLATKYLRHGFGAIVGFGIKGGMEAGRRFIDRVRLLSHLANIGDAKSCVIHPASTTHQQLSPEDRLKAGVTDDFIRFSVGLEAIEDIIDDLDQALK